MQMIRECGFMAYVVLALGLLAVVVGLVAVSIAILAPRIGLVVSVLALAVSCGVPGAGAAGTMWNRSKIEDALAGASVDPAQKERIREIGQAEAAQCTTLGLGAGALPLLLSIAALGAAFMRRKSRPEG